MNPLNLNKLGKLAQMAAKEAGRYIQSQLDQQYDKQVKEGGDSLASQVVTAVDFKAQEIILRHLVPSLEEFGLGLLTEESTDDRSRSEKAFFWCVDPMDGTLPFTERRTGYAVSIALISSSGDPVIGVAYIPDLKECYSAIKNQGVLLNGEPLLREKVTQEAGNRVIHFYMDASFKKEPYYEFVREQFARLRNNRHAGHVEYHDQYGGVRNALGVMRSGRGCYFKFPKERKGCGSIWDYASTRLFFEELQLQVCNASGARLDLNNTESTFMNHCGILYTTDRELLDFIIEIGEKVKDRFVEKD